MDNKENLVSDMLYEANRTTSALECYPLGSEPDWEDYWYLEQVRSAIYKNLDQKFQYLSSIHWYGEALKIALEWESTWRNLLLKKYREFIIEDLIKNHVKTKEDTMFGVKLILVSLDLPTGWNFKYFAWKGIDYYIKYEYNDWEIETRTPFNLNDESILENVVYTKEELLQIYKSILDYMNVHGAEFKFSLESIEDLEQEDEEIKEFYSLIKKIIPIPDFSIYGCGDEITPKYISNYLWNNSGQLYRDIGSFQIHSWTILLNFDKIWTLC